MPVPGLSVPGRGLGLSFGLGYNSLAGGQAGSSGFGWSNTLGMNAKVLADGSAVVTQETGATVRFAPNGSGGWMAPARFSATLVSDAGGTLTFTRNHFERFTFSSADGRLLSMADQFSNVTTVHYPSGSTSADYLVDSAGRRLNIGWSGGRIASVTDQLSGSGGPRSLAMNYGAAGDLVDYKDASGGHWVFTYDGSHRMLTMRKPRQSNPAKVIDNHYDAQGRVDWQEDELDRRTSLAYDVPVAGSTTITHPDQKVQIDRFVDGRREQTRTGVGTAAEVSTSFSYDPATLALVSVTDNAGKVTKFTSDPVGNQTSMTDPTGRVTRWSYNAFDQPTSMSVGETAAPLPASTAAVVTSVNSFDAQGRLLQTKAAAGSSEETVTTFNHATTAHPEDVTSVVDARNKTWSFTYDPATGDRSAATDPLGNITAWTYNNVGWVLTETAPKGTATPTVGDFQTSYAHDVAARRTTVTGPSGEVSKTTLDANGNTSSSASGVTAADPVGDVTTYAYSDADELITVDPPGPGAKSYSYWPDGQRKRYTDENGGHWDYTYDGSGRLATQADPVGALTSYGYDSAGRLAAVTQPGPGATCSGGAKVNCVTYSYDPAGRPVAVDYSDPATADLTAITYDALGRRTNASSDGVAETWAWDRLSRVTSHVDANGRSTGFEYDKAGNVTGLQYPGMAQKVVRSFDDGGRMVSTTDGQGRTTAFGFDADSNWTSTAFPGSTGHGDVYGFDQADRMTSATWNGAGGATLGAEAYTRAPADKGMITSTTRSGAAGSAPTGYGYDGRDRLTAASAEAYVYDPTSNLTKRADGSLQVFDPAQQLCWTSPTVATGTCGSPAADATTFGYDARGNRTAENGPAEDGSVAYGYDQANRLSSAAVTAGLDGGSGQYHEIASKRIADTRNGTGTCLPSPCAKAQTGTPVSITVGTAGSPIPSSGVSAVAATVSIPSANISSYARVNPTASSAAATVAFDAAGGANQFVIAPVINGKIVIQVYGTGAQADVVVDVAGYYTTGAGDPAATYFPTSPAQRLVDTRSTTINHGLCPTTACSTLAAQTSVAVQASGRAGPAGVGAAGRGGCGDGDWTQRRLPPGRPRRNRSGGHHQLPRRGDHQPDRGGAHRRQRPFHAQGHQRRRCDHRRGRLVQEPTTRSHRFGSWPR